MSIVSALRSAVSPMILVAAAIAAATVACAGESNDPNADESEATADAGAGAPTTDAGPPAFAPGTHVSVHGMVLFGTEKLYLSHIPLFATPHNIQVLIEVKPVSGVPQANFSNRGFTFQPGAPFSLSDLARGAVRGFTGTVFQGNFESGGTPVLQNAKFEVTKVVFARNMALNAPANPSLDYVAVGTPSDAFLVHVIDKAPSFDSVVHVQLGPGSSLDAAALAAGTLVRFQDRPNTVARRVGPNVAAEAVKLSASFAPSGEESPIRVLNENSCLQGPDFFNPCPPAQP
jgi:hypothetical protein